MPHVAFLLPEPGDFVDAPTAGSLGVGGRLTAEAVRELVLGELGAIGRGRPDWELPRAVVLAGSVDDWVPARDFWEDRGASRTEAEIQALEELVNKWREEQ